MNKEHEVIEIIKTKGIDVDAIKYHKDLAHYNFSLGGKFEKLTQEEFDLLKEVLCSTENSFISKYIRTKDNIWERNDVGGLTYGYRPSAIGGWEHTSSLKKEEIIGEANEIAKLCDLFVVTCKDGKHDIYAYESKLPTDLLDNDVYITNLYGAIWTKKGLKYVAEYKNGKWELL